MEVREAGERLKFLMDYALLNEDDIKLNCQTFNWPGRMEPIFEVSQQRLTSRREMAEEKVKEKYVYSVNIRSINGAHPLLSICGKKKDSEREQKDLIL
jgi:hypothetical protein